MILFQERHIPMIRSGEKTATRRIWDDDKARPNVGAVHIAATEMFQSHEESDCYIRITDVYRERLGDMGWDGLHAEGYRKMWRFQVTWEELHGELDLDEVVDVVEFEYVGRERPEEDHA